MIEVKYHSIFLFLCLLLGVSALSAEAQGIKVNKGALEKTTWHKSPLEIQILDDGSGGARGAINPNMLNGLPKAGFESNYRPTVVMPQQALPSGTSTNVMLNRLKSNRSTSARIAQPNTSAQMGVKTKRTTTSVATYDTVYSRGSLLNKSAPSQVKTSVQGEVRRGSLLSK